MRWAIVSRLPYLDEVGINTVTCMRWAIVSGLPYPDEVAINTVTCMRRAIVSRLPYPDEVGHCHKQCYLHEVGYCLRTVLPG